ncbi:MAG: TetR/AcrR family transcriptional regulator [Clostridia bacterium]|nr:TetR/AcrR family transcriptional regulator [Clostridia bacterium]
MSQLTKKAIIDYTIALAQTKPVPKITVRDIVDACGITRNTFYYYFHDIYDVIEAFFSIKIEEIHARPDLSLEEEFFELIEFCVSHRKLFLNLYKSLGYERVSSYIRHALHELIISYLVNIPDGDRIPEEDLNIICGFYEEAITGVMIRWMTTTRHSEDHDFIQKRADRVRYLFDGQLKQIFRRSLADEQSPKDGQD